MTRELFRELVGFEPEQINGYDPEDGDEFLADLVSDVMFAEKAEQDKWDWYYANQI